MVDQLDDDTGTAGIVKTFTEFIKIVNKKEFYIIGIGLGALIPIIMLVFFWWPVSALTIFRILDIPESMIKIFALSGFILGIIIDILFLKKLIKQFYKLKTLLLILLYLFCSVMAVSFFMGLPVGNLCLGIIAGLYIGRKYHYLIQNRETFSSISKIISLFTASVTSVEALFIGFIILLDETILISTNQFLGMQLFSMNRLLDFFIILILCMILFVIQFYLTKIASKIAFRI